MPEMDLAFNIQNIKLADDCSNNFLLIKDSPLCGTQSIASIRSSSTRRSKPWHGHRLNEHINYHKHHHMNKLNDHPRSSSLSPLIQASIVMKREEIPGYVNGYPVSGDSIFLDKVMDKIVDIYFTTNFPDHASFQLYWSQISVLPDSVDSTEALVLLSSECDFLCKSSRSCIKSSLVCNGFPNCPLTSPADPGHHDPSSSVLILSSEDEDEALCHRPSILLSFISNHFVLITVFLIIVFTFAVTLMPVVRRLRGKYRRKSEHF